MPWILAATAIIIGGGYLAYATGVDDEIYRTVMNFGANIFVYILAKVIDLFCWFLDIMPVLPYAGYMGPINSLITVLARANTFFPVVETCFMFGFTVTFLLIFISIKFVLKLIPTIG